MYRIFIANHKTEKRINDYLSLRGDIQEKIDKLKFEPKRANGAHSLHGRLDGKWSCWLGSNIRLIYSIDDTKNIIILEAVGSHKIY